MKKLTNLFSISILFVLMCTLIGCDDTDPISLGGVTEVNLYLDADPQNIDIEGGDGSYSVTSNDPEIVRAELVIPGTLRIYPVSVGTTTVIITDGAGNNFRLTVTVSYRTTSVQVSDGVGVIVEGIEDIEDVEKDEIVEIALARVPFQGEGGYLFTYNSYDSMKGEAIIYTEKFGEGGIKTTFEIITHEKYWEEVYGTNAYRILIDGEERDFMPGPRPAIKSTGPTLIGFVEDVTYLFEKDYPNVKRVLTIQSAIVF